MGKSRGGGKETRRKKMELPVKVISSERYRKPISKVYTLSLLSFPTSNRVVERFNFPPNNTSQRLFLMLPHT